MGIRTGHLLVLILYNYKEDDIHSFERGITLLTHLLFQIHRFYFVTSPLPDIANFSTKYFVLNKLYTNEGV